MSTCESEGRLLLILRLVDGPAFLFARGGPQPTEQAIRFATPWTFAAEITQPMQICPTS